MEAFQSAKLLLNDAPRPAKWQCRKCCTSQAGIKITVLLGPDAIVHHVEIGGIRYFEIVTLADIASYDYACVEIVVIGNITHIVYQ